MPALLRPHLPKRLLAATLAIGAFAAAPAQADAASVRTTSPVAGASLVGAVKWTAATDTQAREVRFLVDGEPRWTEYNAPYTFNGAGYLDTAAMTTGAHTLTVRARFGGKWTSHTVKVYVSRPAATTEPAPDTDIDTTSGDTTSPTTSPTPTTTTTTTTTTSTKLPTAMGTLLFSDTFALGKLDNFTAVQTVSADRITTGAAPGGRAGSAARFEVRNGDHVNGEPNSRAELSWSGTKFGEGEEVVYSWSTYIPADYPITDGWQTTTQLKGEGTGGPPVELGIARDKFGLSLGPQENYRELYLVPLERGKWMDITLRVRFSEDRTKGWVEAWHNGVQVVKRTYGQTLIAGAKSYFKFGLYRQATIQPTASLYHSNLLIGRGA